MLKGWSVNHMEIANRMATLECFTSGNLQDSLFHAFMGIDWHVNEKTGKTGEDF